MLGEVSFLGKEKRPDVLRALWITDSAAKARLHTLRREPDLPLGAVDGLARTFARVPGKYSGGLVPPAAGDG